MGSRGHARSKARSVARLAATSNDDVAHAADADRLADLVGDAKIEPLNAAHHAAIGAQEVHMIIARVRPLRELESPHMVPVVGPRKQASVGKVDQVAIHGRPIEPLRYELVGELRVAHGSSRAVETIEHGDPRGRAPEPYASNGGAQYLNVGRTVCGLWRSIQWTYTGQGESDACTCARIDSGGFRR